MSSSATFVDVCPSLCLTVFRCIPRRRFCSVLNHVQHSRFGWILVTTGSFSTPWQRSKTIGGLPSLPKSHSPAASRSTGTGKVLCKQSMSIRGKNGAWPRTNILWHRAWQNKHQAKLTQISSQISRPSLQQCLRQVLRILTRRQKSVSWVLTSNCLMSCWSLSGTRWFFFGGGLQKKIPLVGEKVRHFCGV